MCTDKLQHLLWGLIGHLGNSDVVGCREDRTKDLASFRQGQHVEALKEAIPTEKTTDNSVADSLFIGLLDLLCQIRRRLEEWRCLGREVQILIEEADRLQSLCSIA
jgi:hypothetical protein